MSGHRPVPAIPQQPQQTTNIAKPLPSVPSPSSSAPSSSPKTPASGAAVVVADAAAVRHFVQKTRSASGERRLYVTVATGKALPSKSLTGSPSAYCKLGIISSSSSNSPSNGASSGILLPSDCQRTKVCRGTAAPIWHQQFVFPIKGYGTTSDLTLVDSGGEGTTGDKFILECYHSHRGVYSTFIGFIEISVSSIVNELEENILKKDMREFDAGEEYLKGNRLTKWYPLRKQLPKKKSSLTSFLGGSGGSGTQQPQLGEIQLVISLDLTDDQLAYLRVQQAKDQAEYEQLRQQKQRFEQQQQPHGALGRSTGGGVEEGEDEDEYIIDEDEDEVEIETYQEVEFSIAQNDRLKQLQQAQEKFKSNVTKAQQQSPEMLALYKRFANIKGNMKLVLEEVQGIKSKLPVLASAAGFEQQEINAAIQKHIERGNTLLKGLGQELGRMDKENKDMAKTSEGKKSVEYSIRKTTHGSFVRKLSEVSRLFHKAQSDCRDIYRKRIISQIQAVDITATEEELERELDNAFESGSMNSYFSKHLLDEAVRHEKAKDEFQNISGVYNELVQLEKSMSQLLDLFIQVATLVAEQQTSIDNIEHYLNDASAGQEGMVRRLQIKRAQKWF